MSKSMVYGKLLEAYPYLDIKVKKVTLKDSTANETIYPQIFVDSIQDEAGNILPNFVLMKDDTTVFTPTVQNRCWVKIIIICNYS